MKLKKMVIVAALTVPTLGACGKAPSEASTSALQSEKKQDGNKDKKSLFNLAEYIADSKYYDTFKPYLANGDIIFGDMKKIGVRSNAKVETTGQSSLTPNGSRNISAQYYLMGAVYPNGIKMPNGAIFKESGVTTANGTFIKNPFNDDSNDLERSIFEIKAKAGFDVEGVEGEVRILGNSKYALDHKLEYKQSFTRDLELSYPIFPGGSVQGKIGGELGFTIKAGIRKDDAASLYFQPNIKVQASIAPKIGIVIADLKLEGGLTLMETEVSTSANLSYLPGEDFVYGSIGMDGGITKILDGYVKLVAKFGFNAIIDQIMTYLPGGFDKYWTRVSEFLGFELGLKWEYMVWDPEAVATGKIEPKDVFFTSDMSNMTPAECRSARDEVYAAGDKMAKVKKDAKGATDAAIAQTAEANLARTALYINSNCGK